MVQPSARSSTVFVELFTHVTHAKRLPVGIFLPHILSINPHMVYQKLMHSRAKFEPGTYCCQVLGVQLLLQEDSGIDLLQVNKCRLTPSTNHCPVSFSSMCLSEVRASGGTAPPVSLALASDLSTGASAVASHSTHASTSADIAPPTLEDVDAQLYDRYRQMELDPNISEPPAASAQSEAKER